MKTLAAGTPLIAANAVPVTPTYVPDLTNAQPITWADLALKACAMANVDPGRLEARPRSSFDYVAVRPSYNELGTEKAVLLPTLDDALLRYLRLQEQAAEEDTSGAAAQVGKV